MTMKALLMAIAAITTPTLR